MSCEVDPIGRFAKEVSGDWNLGGFVAFCSTSVMTWHIQNYGTNLLSSEL